MESLQLPDKFEIKKISEFQSYITIEPCYPGYGSTLGNALRRVLLSSLPGSAITALRIKEADHEFSSIPGVKEDVVQIILNLKKIRFKTLTDDEIKGNIKIKGEKIVKAQDIKLTSGAEVVNKEVIIANLTEKNSELDIELTISKGRGYLPVENIEKKKLALGTIAVDAVFTPVKNVNFNVENVRVGQMTNYDKLILNITTDGTINPVDAIKNAAELLNNHFNQIMKFGVSKNEALLEIKSTEIKKSDSIKSGEEVEIQKPKKKRGRPKKES
ncbi:MAG: DNA-directed RNA polymerase subunit alpha [Patescibacteria group bacterium]|jgi:DNA-directed RNA polymerase subunit alpha